MAQCVNVQYLCTVHLFIFNIKPQTLNLQTSYFPVNCNIRINTANISGFTVCYPYTTGPPTVPTEPPSATGINVTSVIGAFVAVVIVLAIIGAVTIIIVVVIVMKHRRASVYLQHG